jgi:hypothetical protein
MWHYMLLSDFVIDIVNCNEELHDLYPSPDISNVIK